VNTTQRSRLALLLCVAGVVRVDVLFNTYHTNSPGEAYELRDVSLGHTLVHRGEGLPCYSVSQVSFCGCGSTYTKALGGAYDRLGTSPWAIRVGR